MEQLIKIKDADLPNNDHYDMIDVFRLICSILIMIVHISPFSNCETPSVISYVGSLINDFAGTIAVPFFFVTSGFLLFKRTTPDHLDVGYILRYIKRIFRLYIIWTIIYFPLELTIRKDSFDFIQYLWNVVISGSFHLWYLNALMFSVALISFLLYRKTKPETILRISFCFNIIAILSRSWYGLLKPVQELLPSLWNLITSIGTILVSTRNGLFFGFLYVSMGMFFAYKDVVIDKKRNIFLWLVSWCFMFIEFIFTEYFKLANLHDVALFMIPVTFFTFSMAKESDFKLGKNFNLGSLSALVYYIHFWIGKIYRIILSDVPDTVFKANAIFLFSLVTSFLVSEIIIYLSKKEKLRFLTYLYK